MTLTEYKKYLKQFLCWHEDVLLIHRERIDDVIVLIHHECVRCGRRWAEYVGGQS